MFLLVELFLNARCAIPFGVTPAGLRPAPTGSLAGLSNPSSACGPKSALSTGVETLRRT
jgi:hypothetical protein